MEKEKINVSVSDELEEVQMKLLGLSCICNDVFTSLEYGRSQQGSAPSLYYISCALDELSDKLSGCIPEVIRLCFPQSSEQSEE